MALTPWKKLSEKVVSRNLFWKHVQARFIGPSGKEGVYDFAVTKGAVAIVAVDHQGRIPLVRQYRFLFSKESLEFPMGGRDDDDSLTAAKREFAEEAKMEAEQWESVGSFESCPGMVQDICDVFVANGLSPCESGHDPNEEFEHLLLTPEEVDAAIARHEITNGMSIAAWALAKPKILQIIDQQTAKR